ncbi:MAG: hypothetical protein ACYCU7_15630 [Acidimicrobiales bacterium]
MDDRRLRFVLDRCNPVLAGGGARLEVEDDDGGGTVVTVTWPVADDA